MKQRLSVLALVLARGLALAGAAGVLGAVSGFAQSFPKMEKDLTSLLIQSQAKKRFVGLSVLVLSKKQKPEAKGLGGWSSSFFTSFTDDGQYHQYKKHFGYRDSGRSKAPDDQTIYEIGSITKVMTRLAIASQTLIQPDDVLSEHLPPDIRTPLPHEQEYSILDLLTHTAFTVEHPCIIRAADPKTPVCHGIDPKSGLKDPYGKGSRSKTYDFVMEYSSAIDDFPWSFPKPGVFRTYSNVGVGLVGELLGQAHDVSYEHYVKTKLLEPLGMNRTMITLPCGQSEGSPCPNVADPHLYNFESKTWQPWPRFTMPGLPGAGAMHSSLADLGTFLRATLTPESSPLPVLMAKGGEYLEEVTVKHNSNICKPGETPAKNFCNAEKMVYNYAWQPQRLGERFLYHGGRTTGSESIMMFSADRSAGVVVLVNGSQIAVPEAKRYHLPYLVARCALQMLGKIAKKPDACIELKLK